MDWTTFLKDQSNKNVQTISIYFCPKVSHVSLAKIRPDNKIVEVKLSETELHLTNHLIYVGHVVTTTQTVVINLQSATCLIAPFLPLMCKSKSNPI